MYDRTDGWTHISWDFPGTKLLQNEICTPTTQLPLYSVTFPQTQHQQMSPEAKVFTQTYSLTPDVKKRNLCLWKNTFTDKLYLKSKAFGRQVKRKKRQKLIAHTCENRRRGDRHCGVITGLGWKSHFESFSVQKQTSVTEVIRILIKDVFNMVIASGKSKRPND